MANLSYGSKGSDVAAMQQQLRNAGYNIAVDGSFGPATQAAVKDYQSKNGLAVDGIVGKNTSASLNSSSSKSSGPSSSSGSASRSSGPSSSGPSTKTAVGPGVVQTQTPTQTTVTGSGNLASGTKSSDVIALQQRLNELGYGLAVDGSYGPATKAAVMDYQSKNGLAVDGIVGVNTRNALNTVSNPTPTQTQPIVKFIDEDEEDR